MSVRLESIAFNHDPGSATTDALNIRKNKSDDCIVPEWRNIPLVLTVNPEDCPVAYAIEETRGRVLTVRATFRRLDRSLSSVLIRTSNPPSRFMETFSWIFARLENWRNRFVINVGGTYASPPPPPPPSFPNTLGDVPPTRLQFGASDVVTVVLPLNNTRIWNRGVGRYDDAWHWQYQPGNGRWTEFQLSRHRVYILLSVPKDPWTQVPQASDLPWTEVLDHTCKWASGQMTPDGIGNEVTKAVNALGGACLSYDHLNKLQHFSSVQGFDCTKFLGLLQAGAGAKSYADCRDCANIVVSFANVLGCDLSALRLGQSPIAGAPDTPEFAVKEIRLIGDPGWTAGLVWDFHAVASRGISPPNVEVFDACLELDRAAPNRAPLLPVNLPFNQYRDLLIPLTDQQHFILSQSYRASIS